MGSGLRLRPIIWRDACAYVKATHRHHVPSQGSKFSVAAMLEEKMVGVAVGGRPVARMLDDGLTLEVTRLSTDGTKNACSFLYGAMRRIANEMGYKLVITCILASEPGTSLRAAGWQKSAASTGGTWSRPSRRRIDSHPTEAKQRWEALL